MLEINLKLQKAAGTLGIRIPITKNHPNQR